MRKYLGDLSTHPLSNHISQGNETSQIIISTFNRLRKKIPAANLSNLSRHVKSELALDLQEHIKQPYYQLAKPNQINRLLLEKFMTTIDADQIDCTSLKKAIYSSPANLILGLFDVPYIPSLGLDALSFESIDLPEALVQKYPSNALPIIVENATDGFNNPKAVAIFPEHFISKTSPQETDKIYYFIDKFRQRFFDITLKIIKSQWVCNQSFSSLKNASYDDIKKNAAIWVRLHEFFHTQGDLPLPKYLEYKSNRSIAGLEELRVDLHTMLELQNILQNPNILSQQLDAKIALSTFEFILAERLIRYPIEKSPQDDYDARGSIILMNHLIKEGAIQIDEKNILSIQANLVDSLRSLLNQIQTVEKQAKQQIHQGNPKQARSLLLKFAQSKSIMQDRFYKTHPFFETIAEFEIKD